MKSKRILLAGSVLCLLSVALSACATATPTPTPVPTKPAAAVPTKPAAAEQAKPAAKEVAKPAAKPAEKSAARAPLSPPVKVRYGANLAASDGPIYVALEKGYFKEEGIDVEITTFDTAAKMIPALSTGQLEAGGGGITVGLFNAFAREIGIRVVADRSGNAAGHEVDSFALRPDLADRVKDFKDMKGLKIALTAKGAPPHPELGKALAKGGLTTKDVEMIEMPWPDAIAALTNKAVDMVIFSEPFSTQVVEQGVAIDWKRVHPDIDPDRKNGVLMYGPQFVQSQPEAARRFMIAYIRGIRTYLDAMDKNVGKDEVINILVKNTTIKDRAVYLKMKTPGFDRNGYASIKQLVDDQNFFVGEGLIKLDQKADVNKMVDNSYVEYALSVVGKE
ncbi:MAG: ABC transporter substrate-binding protein [Chloroflexi bacterium]|nr:ABC transporter substrate-binding protein [Chloroflexota bacterium]